MEKHYALLKENRVMNIIVVEEQNDEAVEAHCNEMGYDEFLYLNTEQPMPMHSLRVNGEFIPADYDYLKSIGLSRFNNAEWAEYQAAQGGN
jgi:hypothetical protein